MSMFIYHGNKTKGYVQKYVNTPNHFLLPGGKKTFRFAKKSKKGYKIISEKLFVEDFVTEENIRAQVEEYILTGLVKFLSLKGIPQHLITPSVVDLFIKYSPEYLSKCVPVDAIRIASVINLESWKHVPEKFRDDDMTIHFILKSGENIPLIHGKYLTPKVRGALIPCTHPQKWKILRPEDYYTKIHFYYLGLDLEKGQGRHIIPKNFTYIAELIREGNFSFMAFDNFPDEYFTYEVIYEALRVWSKTTVIESLSSNVPYGTYLRLLKDGIIQPHHVPQEYLTSEICKHDDSLKVKKKAEGYYTYDWRDNKPFKRGHMSKNLAFLVARKQPGRHLEIPKKYKTTKFWCEVLRNDKSQFDFVPSKRSLRLKSLIKSKNL